MPLKNSVRVRKSNKSNSDNNDSKHSTDFSKVGGLSNHLKILRDLIIVPLLHSNVYKHFNIKMPKGVLFYGPPGTGKTLVAGALAAEMNKEGFGKVNFFQRKGADVLDKWVGESERKLRTLFENATKSRPSVIFFDEIDGLAPIRSPKNDHVHCSIVTTLLALMDGLDSQPGVIVIGATNKIEAVDPALRRPGRFDKELFFPLPCTEARKEILQVHTQSWQHKPSSKFMSHLAEITTGFCGSDLQALCAETVLCSMKRHHPDIQKRTPGGANTKIKAEGIKIEECDFLAAKQHLAPSSQKTGVNIRKLCPVVRSLLERQLNLILARLRMMYPHFFKQNHPYTTDDEKYIGRMLLIGSNSQGVSTHLVPAILHNLEHIPAQLLDVTSITEKKITNFCQTLPSILVLPRVDELWCFIDGNDQICVTSALEDIHAGLPILVIATCENELPETLQNFFNNNTSVVVQVENPTVEEIEDFFMPLFFCKSGDSISHILTAHQKRDAHLRSSSSREFSKSTKHHRVKAGKIVKPHSKTMLKFSPTHCNTIQRQRQSTADALAHIHSTVEDRHRRHADDLEKICTLCGSSDRRKSLSVIVTDLLQRSMRFIIGKRVPVIEKCCRCRRKSSFLSLYGNSSNKDKQKIYSLWLRTSLAAKGMLLTHLEVLYDAISACISIHKNDFDNLIRNVELTLSDIENSK